MTTYLNQVSSILSGTGQDPMATVTQVANVASGTGQKPVANVQQVCLIVCARVAKVTPGPQITYNAKMPCKAGNDYDRCLLAWAEQYNRVKWPIRPDFSGMPDLGVEFRKFGSVVTPAPVDGDVSVLKFTVPYTYNGIIYGITLQYTGTGFIQGSGDIFWRVKVGNAYPTGWGNVGVEFGSVAQSYQITDHIKCYAGQTIEVVVNVPNSSGDIQVGASRINAVIQGWYAPVGHEWQTNGILGYRV